MAVCSLTIIPIGTKTASVSKFVAETVDIIKKHNLRFTLSANATIIEAELKKILDIIPEIRDSVYRQGANRVVINLSIDERNDKNLTINDKIKSVEEKL